MLALTRYRPAPVLAKLVSTMLVSASLLVGCEPQHSLPPAGPTQLENSLMRLAASVNSIHRAIDLWAIGAEAEAIASLTSGGIPSGDELNLDPERLSNLGVSNGFELDDIVHIVDHRGLVARPFIRHIIQASIEARAAGHEQRADTLCALVDAIIAANRKAKAFFIREIATVWSEEQGRAGCPPLGN